MHSSSYFFSIVLHHLESQFQGFSDNLIQFISGLAPCRAILWKAELLNKKIYVTTIKSIQYKHQLGSWKEMSSSGVSIV